jgi:hypothetical protein
MADRIDRLRSLIGEGEWTLPLHPKTPVSEKGQDVEQGSERQESWYDNVEDHGDEDPDPDEEEIVDLNKPGFSSLSLFDSGFVLPEFNLATGELAPLGEKFSPLSALLNYPNHYLTGNRRQKVSYAYLCVGIPHNRSFYFRSCSILKRARSMIAPGICMFLLSLSHFPVMPIVHHLASLCIILYRLLSASAATDR